ncbi:MAG: RNA methyltransferase substrate-binding domain-containing protein [Thermoproteota archaeon]|nr:RNA methyltransferase substrate-binding domain-containing protein [Thermoproteota archaeon]
MNKSSFFIIGQHAVIEALRNPKRKVLRVFLTEESKKNIHRKSPNKNLLNGVKVYFKTKKEFCVICNKKMGFIRYNPKPEWKIKGQLCRRCWDEQKAKNS